MAVEPGTPLPWVVDPVMAWVSPATDHDAPVCALRVETDGVNREVEAAQDARYIVHACNNFPALLEALEFIVSDSVSLEQAMSAARAAIAKATGREP